MGILRRILYVDDDSSGCEMMSFWLNRKGYEVTTAEDRSTACSLIDGSPFDLYMLDYCLPGITAVNLCQKIRQNSPTAPIIIYSALSRDIDRQTAFEAGASAYLVKPNDLDQVLGEVERFLHPSESFVGRLRPKIRHRAASIF